MPIKKEASYIGLVESADIRYSIFDNDPISKEFFEIVDFPEVLTGGKNVIKFRGDPDNLVDDSQIYIEILDYNGDPIYYEVLNYLEKDGSRVISIWVYDDTPDGQANVYLAGRAINDPQTGEQFAYNNDMASADYKQIPNVLWSRPTRVAPNRRNSSEIIFPQPPQVDVIESVKTFMQVENLPTFFTQVSGSSTTTPAMTSAGIGPGGGYSTITTVISQPYAPSLPVGPVPNELLESQYSANTVASSMGSSMLAYSLPISLATDPAIIGNTVTTTGTNAATITPSGITMADATATVGIQGPGGTTLTALPPTLGPATSTVETIQTSVSTLMFNLPDTTTMTLTGLPLSGSRHLGATVIINNPYILAESDHRINANGQIVHHTATNDVGFATQGQATPVDATWVATIVDIENSTTAKLSPAFNFLTKRTSTDSGHHVVDYVASPLTMSFWVPQMTQDTENSMSFASITLKNIEPLTGDVHSIKTSYKMLGAPGSYIDAGNIVLERYDVLNDPNSQTPGLFMGMYDTKFGEFHNQSIINNYWDISENSTALFDNDYLGESVQLTWTGSAMQPSDYAQFSVTPAYQPDLYAYTSYQVHHYFIQDNMAVQWPVHLMKLLLLHYL